MSDILPAPEPAKFSSHQHGNLRLYLVTHRSTDESGTPMTEVIEREHYWAQGGMLFFANGGEYLVKTEVLSINQDLVARVEEITHYPDQQDIDEAKRRENDGRPE